MVQREAELQTYLSSKEEKLRSQELNLKIEASLEELLDQGSASSPKKSDGSMAIADASSVQH